MHLFGPPHSTDNGQGATDNDFSLTTTSGTLRAHVARQIRGKGAPGQMLASCSNTGEMERPCAHNLRRGTV